MFCNVLLPPSCPLSIFWLLFIINTYKSNRVRSRKVKSTILCHFKSQWNRNVLPPSVLLTTDVPLKSDLNIPPNVLRYCTTAVLIIHQRAGAHLQTRVWYHPDLLLQPTVRHHVFNQPVSGSEWYAACISQLESDLKALQGSREALKSGPVTHAAELDLTSSPAGVWVSMWFFWPSKMDVYQEPRQAPYTSVCISMCLHSVKCAQHAWKHTRKMVSKRE